MFEKIKQIAPIILILLLSLAVVWPYFQPGFFPTHDGGWVPVRLAEMIRELKDFQIPPRMSGFLNHGYGYPLFNFTYPLPYYLGTFFYILGFGLVGSTKILFALTVPLSGIFIYYLSKELWKSRLAGLISAVFYIFLPYRIVDLYARGSIGESISLALFPLILFLVLKKSPLLAPAIAMLITTHNIMAVLFLPLMLIFSWIYKKNILFSFFLGLGLACFFWLPALIEKNNIILSKIPIADRSLYFLKPLDLIIPKWGYGIPTNPDGFGYQLGLPQALSILLVSLLAFVKKSKTTLMLVALTLIPSFLFFEQSTFFWKAPLLREINYPWTLLAPLGFLSCVLAGFLVKNKLTLILGIVLSFGVVVLCLPHARPSSYNSYPDEFYQTNDATTTSSDELMPLWVKSKPTKRQEKLVTIISGSGEIKTLKDSSNKIVAEGNFQSDSVLELNKIHYPGWNWSLKSSLSSNGLITLDANKGKYLITGNFTETPLRLFADLITIGSLIILFSLLAVKIRTWRV